MTNATERDELAVLLHSTTDAQVWAKAFVATFDPDLTGIDEGTMLGWMANAIEVGREAGAAPVRAELAEMRGCYERACLTIAELFHAGTGIPWGDGPRRGLVEDVRDERARLLALAGQHDAEPVADAAVQLEQLDDGLCPTCASPYAGQCRCPGGHRVCSEGHHWSRTGSPSDECHGGGWQAQPGVL